MIYLYHHFIITTLHNNIYIAKAVYQISQGYNKKQYNPSTQNHIKKG